jgi:hypothetical protein
VRVRVIDPVRAERMAFVDGAWMYSYEEGRALLLIDGRLPLPVQRYVLLHECQHAMVDVLDIGLEKAPDQVQTKLAAAQRAYAAGTTDRA